MRLTSHTIDSAPGESIPTLKAISEELGLIPNLAATAATSPALLQAFDSLRRAAAATSIDPVMREIAGLATGVAVDNAYGIAFHSTTLANLGMADEDIDRIRHGQPPSDPVGSVVQALATELAGQRGKVADGTIGQAYAAGLTDETILDVAVEVAFASLVGLIDNLAGRVPLDDFLIPRTAS